MKKILLSLLILSFVGFVGKLQAQNCSITNTVISVNSTTVVGPNLDVNFNISFDLDANGGNKYLFIQSWKATQWPNYWGCVNGQATINPKKAPQGATLTNAFLKLAINNDVTDPAQPTFTTYDFDGTTMTNSAGITLTKIYNAITVGPTTYDRFTMNNIMVTIPGVTNPNDALAVLTDVFSTNGQVTGPNSPIHCVNCGITQFFNDPAISGFKNCSTPRQYSLGITTVDPTPKTVTYKVYLDANSNNLLDGSDILAFTSGSIVISSGSGYSSGLQTLPPPYSNTNPNASYNYIILIEGVTLSNSIVKLLPGPVCSPLPVDFKSFTAIRNKANVQLNWVTSSEKNSSGFAIERNLDGTNWEEVAFVPTRAIGGTSNEDLAYQYIDHNITKGISQYRIRQVDIDNRSKFSEVRSVKGDGQIGKVIVYPNPTANGKFNVVFEDAAVIRNISVIDMSGRTIRTVNGIANTTITIDNLRPGIYSLRIIVPATGEQMVEKIVVNQR